MGPTSQSPARVPASGVFGSSAQLSAAPGFPLCWDSTGEAQLFGRVLGVVDVPSCGSLPSCEACCTPPSSWGCHEFGVKGCNCFETQHVIKPEGRGEEERAHPCPVALHQQQDSTNWEAFQGRFFFIVAFICILFGSYMYLHLVTF